MRKIRPYVRADAKTIYKSQTQYRSTGGRESVVESQKSKTVEHVLMVPHRLYAHKLRSVGRQWSDSHLAHGCHGHLECAAGLGHLAEAHALLHEQRLRLLRLLLHR